MHDLKSLDEYLEFLKVCQQTSSKLCAVDAHCQSVAANTKNVRGDLSAFCQEMLTRTQKVLMCYEETAATNLASCFQIIESWISELFTSDVLVTACDITCNATADNGVARFLEGNVGKVQQQEGGGYAVGGRKRPREMFDGLTLKRSKYTSKLFDAEKRDYERCIDAAKIAVGDMLAM